MTATVLPTTESTPYSAINSVPTAKAALPLTGRISTNNAVSGGMPNRQNTGASTPASQSIAPDARSNVTAISKITKVGTRLKISFSPECPPCNSKS